MPNRKKMRKKGKAERDRGGAKAVASSFKSREDISRKLSSVVDPDCLSDKKAIFPVRMTNKFLPTYEATVPDGVFPGQNFRVTILGHTSTMICPPDYGPGKRIVFRVPFGGTEPKVIDDEKNEEEDELEEKRNIEDMASIFNDLVFPIPADSSIGRTPDDYVAALASDGNKEVENRFATKLLEVGLQSIAKSTEQEDEDLFLSIVRDWSEEDRIFVLTLHAVDSDQINATLSKFYDTYAEVINSKSGKMTLPKFENPITKKLYLRKMADEESVRSSMSKILLIGLHKGRKKGEDKVLKASYRQAIKACKEADARNPFQKCSGCLMSKPVEELRKCSECSSVLYCSKECQVKHWKDGHKKECKSLASARISAGQPERKEINAPDIIPSFVLALSPSLTKYPREVHLVLPLWDFQDKEFRKRALQQRMRQSIIEKNLKKFFKLEHLGIKTSFDMVSNMCIDAMTLFLLGYQGSDHGCGGTIRQLSDEEMFLANFGTRREKPSMVYSHYTPVPKGWKIPDDIRNDLDSRLLAELEKGIKCVRQWMGERDALK